MALSKPKLHLSRIGRTAIHPGFWTGPGTMATAVVGLLMASSDLRHLLNTKHLIAGLSGLIA
jgi:hypothetical protein